MKYIKELEAHLERVRAAKVIHLREQEYARAAACRDVEKQLQAQLEHAKKVLTETNQGIQ